ncbi:PKD domain-containing protein [Brumimicrobium aurantiacum]|uniref:PKD domain-containing protein n=1 Tax=Brumimicrobium aurantiacum TaxID=1737063 RepID=A0A3E1EUH5_9FLAO|nr:PKD domain-containing protein [Brumimicrobium aurantiacum]RFC53205.1 PKD domain-containing protein [Brumimicrobium aurantiacum]
MKILITLLLITVSFWSYSQCTVTIETQSDSLDCGDCFDLTAVGVAQDTLLGEDFNSGALGPGWFTSQTLMYTNPCGPTPDGTPAGWFGDQQAHPRELETNDYDLSCGGDICFEMKYATQGGSGSCEGPDLTGEGVDLQYSIDGGVTWVSIHYEAVLNNGTDPIQTQWTQYCHTIPAAAMTTSTRFRWIQTGTSGAGNDHWGLDNIAVLGTICGTYYYDWNVDGTTDPADTNDCIIQNVQTYDVVFTDGISDSCFASIDMYGVIDPNLPNDTSFCGLIDTAIVSNPIGGSGDYDYVWNNGDTDSIYEGPTIGNYYVDIVDVNYPGCTASDSILFQNYPFADVDFDASPLCQGSLTNFTDMSTLPPGFNIDNWSWNFDNQGNTSTDQNPSYEFTGVGTYNVKLTVETEFGCVTDTTIELFIEPSPYANFTYPPVCQGEEIQFTNTSIGNFVNSKWFFETGTDTVYSTDASYTFPSSGTFDVTLTIEDANGDCTNTNTIPVTVLPAPDVSFVADPISGEPVLDVSFFNDPSNLVSNYWDFADGNNTTELNDTIFHSFTDAGVYTVTHTGVDANGCTNTYSTDIFVDFPEVQFEIPNIVTPNNDGVNDGFYINYKAAYETITEFEINILNRWGTSLRTYNEPDFVWDGKSKSGTQVADGTYFYKITFKTLKGKTYNEHGFVQVVNN